ERQGEDRGGHHAAQPEEGEEAGGAEHADSDAGTLALLGQLRLGEPDLRADQLGHLLGQVVDQGSEGGVVVARVSAVPGGRRTHVRAAPPPPGGYPPPASAPRRRLPAWPDGFARRTSRRCARRPGSTRSSRTMSPCGPPEAARSRGSVPSTTRSPRRST